MMQGSNANATPLIIMHQISPDGYPETLTLVRIFRSPRSCEYCRSNREAPSSELGRRHKLSRENFQLLVVSVRRQLRVSGLTIRAEALQIQTKNDIIPAPCRITTSAVVEWN